MNVLTRSCQRRAIGNEIPPPSHARRVGLPLRRLAGVLAGRLDPAPFVLPGHGGAAPTLELSEVAAQPGHLAAILKGHSLHLIDSPYLRAIFMILAAPRKSEILRTSEDICGH